MLLNESMRFQRGNKSQLNKTTREYRGTKPLYPFKNTLSKIHMAIRGMPKSCMWHSYPMNFEIRCWIILMSTRPQYPNLPHENPWVWTMNQTLRRHSSLMCRGSWEICCLGVLNLDPSSFNGNLLLLCCNVTKEARIIIKMPKILW